MCRLPGSWQLGSSLSQFATRRANRRIPILSAYSKTSKMTWQLRDCQNPTSIFDFRFEFGLPFRPKPRVNLRPPPIFSPTVGQLHSALAALSASRRPCWGVAHGRGVQAGLVRRSVDDVSQTPSGRRLGGASPPLRARCHWSVAARTEQVRTCGELWLPLLNEMQRWVFVWVLIPQA